MSLDGDTIGSATLTIDNPDYDPRDPDYNAPCLDTKGVCARVGIKISTLKTHMARGTGPRGYRLPGGSSRWRFTRRDVDAWVKGHEHPPPSARVERLARLQAGGEQVIENKRARRQAESNEEVNA